MTNPGTFPNSKLFFLRPAKLTGTKSYALMLALTLLAAVLSLFAAPLVSRFPFTLFFVAVTVSAWLCGFRQAFLSSLLSAVFVDYYLLPPKGAWALQPPDILRLGLWFLFSLSLAFLCSRLAGSQAQLGTALAGIAEGVLTLDSHWNVVYVNDAGVALLDKRDQTVIGKNIRDLLPDSQVSVMAQLKRCVSESVPVHFDSNCPRRKLDFQIRAYPAPEGISIFVQDVTAAKQREAQLHAVLDRLLAAHKAAQVGTFEWNLKTNHIILSDEAIRNHGWTGAQWDGAFETWANSIHPEDSPGVLAKVQEAIAAGSEFYTEFRALWPNGEIHWLQGHGQPVTDDNGNTEGIVGVCSDITHRRMEEEALRRSEKLATAGRLAATIAHEINNPLEAITNLVYLIRQDSGLGSETAELVRQAEEQLARVNHIAKQTLGFYRDGDRPEPIDVVQKLEDLLAVLQTRINAKQLRIVRDYDNSPGSLYGYKGEIRQVFSNLLTNAIDASPAGGDVIVRVKNDSDASGAPAGVRVEIEDFGPGIEPVNQARIFEPFFTTKSDTGTGLGLWVTRELVEKHRGTISFRSSSAEGASGTCFSVVLPASAKSTHAAA